MKTLTHKEKGRSDTRGTPLSSLQSVDRGFESVDGFYVSVLFMHNLFVQYGNGEIIKTLKTNSPREV